jgi:hypothetical protein
MSGAKCLECGLMNFAGATETRNQKESHKERVQSIRPRGIHFIPLVCIADRHVRARRAGPEENPEQSD